MKVGTPNFVGGRLTEAREARGLTAVSLAQLLDINATGISHYEHGRQTPSPEILERLAVALNCPITFFLKELPVLDNSPTYWRSMSSATKLSRTKAERRFSWLKEVVQHLRRYLEFPTLSLPAISVPQEPHLIDSQFIERAARQCREHWNLGTGPIENVVLLLENNGLMVSRIPLDAESQDAFSRWPPDEPAPYVVLGSDKASAVRSRFDAAHELAHLILHRHIEARHVRNPTLNKMIENQAHRFAGAFLLPEESFIHDVWAPTLSSFRTLKGHWKVAIQAMVMRCNHLGIMDDDQTKRAWINISRKGWRKEEPLDDKIPVERPRLLRRSFELLVASGTGPHQILADLRLPGHDIEELAGLPRGFLRGLNVTEIAEPRLKNENSNGPNTIIQFPDRK